MSFLENCVERTTALAAACGWLAFGGGMEAAVGVAVGGAGLATVVSNAIRRHGPESERALASIRKGIRSDLEGFATAENWETQSELEAADEAMERALAASFLDRQSLAKSALSPAGFPSAATDLILSKLAEKEPSVFGTEGPPMAKRYATKVIEIALRTAIENESYFNNLQPHLMMESLRGLGRIEGKVDLIHGDVVEIRSVVLEISKALSQATDPEYIERMKIEILVNDRGESVILHDQRFPFKLKRLEYSLMNRRLNFVLSGDLKKDFGIPVHEKLAHHLKPDLSTNTLVVLMDEKTGDTIDGGYYPLLFVE